ncbi:Uma2 family endonuclease [Nocardia sp. 2]|uniref:Uma2 family endonuclease n=1 Tax=Nocardia acididurans TaxID=2802282 RepID=A0ABS1MF68_9NOCA|nr:Uma2 family endonuclease [Nocardia acididurans]MBL1078730.1 Uma2 family endonuclease [Nocardia acididurans]
MPTPPVEGPDLPEYMTWEELEQLPDEIAGEIELWEGRVVWVRRGPAEHQDFTNLLWSALRRCARERMSSHPEQCWRVSSETNVFFGRTGKSDFVTPDFLVFRCLEQEYQDIRASDVLVAGEVLAPSNTERDVEAKKARYAGAGIPWYWEVILGRNPRRIASIRAYGLESGHGQLPDGVTPFRPANYIVAGEWTFGASLGIEFDHPFAIRIPWSELEF